MNLHMKKTIISISFVLICASAALSQAPKTYGSDPPKPEGSIRIGLVTPRVSLLGGGGTVTQETSTLQKNIIGYLTGPRMSTVEIKAKLDSLALEEAKDRQCDYVLYATLTRRRAAKPGSPGGYGTGTKTGDDYVFEYKVQATDGSQPAAESSMHKSVSADGEDVVTPMVENLAQVVVGLVKARPTPPPTVAPVHNEETVAAVEHPNPPTTPAPTPTPAPSNSTPTGYGSLTASPRPTASGSTRVNDPPKAEGTIRIGLVTPRVTSVGSGTMGTNEAVSLRQTISSYLAGSIIETIELRARLDSLALTEGQNRDCDYVLYTTLVRKRAAHTSSSSSNPLSSIMGNMGSGVGSKVPGSKTVQKVGTQAASAAGSLASLARANDEVAFEYKLVLIEGAKPVAGKLTRAKVKQDGEDVLSPMIESAAQTIVDVTKKN